MPGAWRGGAGLVDAAGVGAGGLCAAPLRPRGGPGLESELRIVLAISNLSHRVGCVPRWHQGHRAELVPPQYTPALQHQRAHSALYLWCARFFISSPSHHTRTHLTQGFLRSARCCKALGHGKSRPLPGAPPICPVASFTPCCLTAARLCAQPPGLAQQLRLQPKLLRQTLRYFEGELLVRREHRQEKATRRKRPGDVLPDAGARPDQDAAASTAACPATFLATFFVQLVGFLTMLARLDPCDDPSLRVTMYQIGSCRTGCCILSCWQSWACLECGLRALFAVYWQGFHCLSITTAVYLSQLHVDQAV